jgi:hypothetical protein
MATTESWQTRDEILSALAIMKNCLANYKITFTRLNQIKFTVLDDPVKKADLKLLFDQDPSLSMAQVIAEYQAAKAINDWIIANT